MPEDEALDIGARLHVQLMQLAERRQEYADHVARLNTRFQALREQLFHGDLGDEERVALLDEFEGVKAVMDEFMEIARGLSRTFVMKLKQLERLEAHRRASESDAAA